MRFKRFLLLAFLLLGSSAALAVADRDLLAAVLHRCRDSVCLSPGDLPRPRPATVEGESLSLHLELPGELRVNQWIQPRVRVVNQSGETVRLVLPGDGSESHWRTPFIGWSILPAEGGDPHPLDVPLSAAGRCGNLNPVTSNEFVSLRSGHEVSLGDWLGAPVFEEPGDYRVVFHYANVPDHISTRNLVELCPKSRYRLDRSTPCALRSNEVRVTVVR